jgi:transglutaminase-like putative cysteine protease
MAEAADVATPAPVDLRRRIAAAGRHAFDLLTRTQLSSAARERRDMLVLLAALGLIAAPHAQHLAWWASVIFWLLWCWRMWLTLARRPLPGRFALVPLVVAIAAAAWVNHRGAIERDAGITFLLMLAGLKLLEMRSRRDVYVVVVLALFLLLTQFMFDQAPAIAALAVLAVLALFYVLVSVQAVEGDIAAGRKLRLTLVIFAQAAPLALAMFIFFPRIDGPLWGTTEHLGSAQTGLSDTMAPGSMSSLLESEQIAFRVRFDAALPPRAALYWRGPVLSRFDGRIWRARPEPLGNAGVRSPSPREQLVVDPASAVDYEVTVEPHRRTWLFAIEAAAGPVLGPELRAHLGADMQLLAARPLYVRTRYRVRSFVRYAADRAATDAELREWVDLPPGYNPETLAFARDLNAKLVAAGTPPDHGGDPARLAAVLDFLRKGDFHYTLDPPLLGRNVIDEFLFQTRLGFCEHFAAAFVVVMRALNVPARVVTGYQGGELNPTDGYLTVRQSDAHAWGEVWLPERGWVRVDPTALVAPVRLERSAPAADSSSPWLGSFEHSPLAWAHAARLRWEAVENGWNQWVLSYSYDRQRQLISALGIVPTWRTLALIFAGVMAAMLGAIAIATLNPREQADPLARLQQILRRRLTSAGIPIPAHAGLRDTAGLLDGRLRPDDTRNARSILAALETARYAPPNATSVRDRRLLARRVRSFRPRRRR